MPTFATQTAEYHNSSSFEYTRGLSRTAAGSQLSYEIIWSINGTDTNATLGTHSLADGSGYNTCTYCSMLTISCGALCTTSYLARSGTLAVTSAPRSDGGVFVATITNAQWIRWDGTSDSPIADGGCYSATSATISTSY